MTSETAHGHLLEVVIGDDPESWIAAGFTVQGDRFRLGDTTIRLVGADGERGIRSWTLHGIEHSIDGLPTVDASGPAGGSIHPNGVSGIDHVVVGTNDFSRTIPALEKAGLELRRSRTFDLGDGERQQSFFWLGTVILELIGPVEAEPDAIPPARFWGLALTSPDLDATAAHLGEATSTPKDAVQKGRRISTLRTRELSMSLPIAFMSPHVAS